MLMLTPSAKEKGNKRIKYAHFRQQLSVGGANLPLDDSELVMANEAYRRLLVCHPNHSLMSITFANSSLSEVNTPVEG